MTVIRLREVTKRFDTGVEALKGVSADIEQGEFVFVSGHSGAGKTTLIKLLLRLEQVTSGEILVFGKNLKVLQDSAIPYLRRNFGVVFQDFKLLPDLTVFENVALALRFLGLSRSEIRRRVEGTLFDLGIDKYENAYPRMLSGGEQQRVAIARALVNEPAVLLADEPTGNLDWELSKEIVRLFEQVNKKGATVIMATHDKFLLETFKKRVLLLHKGFLIEDTGRKKEKPEEGEEHKDEY
jgi:cell division transport system ATP-binding protein